MVTTPGSNVFFLAKSYTCYSTAFMHPKSTQLGEMTASGPVGGGRTFTRPWEAGGLLTVGSLPSPSVLPGENSHPIHRCCPAGPDIRQKQQHTPPEHLQRRTPPAVGPPESRLQPPGPRPAPAPPLHNTKHNLQMEKTSPSFRPSAIRLPNSSTGACDHWACIRLTFTSTCFSFYFIFNIVIDSI